MAVTCLQNFLYITSASGAVIDLYSKTRAVLYLSTVHPFLASLNSFMDTALLATGHAAITAPDSGLV